MEYRTLGQSEVKVTPIAFGSWAIGGWLWGGAEENDAIRAIRASYDLGVTTFDTALPEIDPKRAEPTTEILALPPRERPVVAMARSVKNAPPPAANNN